MALQDLPELARARQLWAAERHEEAIALFAECAAKHPKNPYALIDTARVYGQWFEFDKMEEHLAKLLRLSERKPDNRLQAGMTYRMNYRPEKALSHLSRAASSRRTAFLANLELAVLYERRGNLKQAEAHAREALREVPKSPEATLVLARTLSRSQRADDAARLLSEKSQQQSGIHHDTRAAGLSLRARIHEQAKEYDKAFTLMGKSKEVLRPIARQLPPGVMSKDSEIAGFFDNLTQQHLEGLLSWNPPNGKKQVCLMASFPRSGTTLLESMLGSHPDVEAADELPVFTNRLLPSIVKQCGKTPAEAPDRFDSFTDEQLLSLRETYVDCQSQVLETPLEGKLLVDKNPSLTVFVPFYLRVFPELKLLVPLRDPRDVILSCYSQYLPINPWSVHFLDLKKAAQRFANVLGYWVKMRRLLPMSSWHEVKYEDLVAAPAETLRQTLGFLELPWHADTLSYYKNPNIKVHNAPTYADVKEAPHRRAVGRWTNYADHFEPLRPLLEPVMGELGYCW